MKLIGGDLAELSIYRKGLTACHIAYRVKHDTVLHKTHLLIHI